MIVLPLAMLYVSLFVGRFDVTPNEVAQILWAQLFPTAHTWPKSVETIVLQIRLPRAILVLFVGAGLAISGAAFQGMFRNPLVSTDILGVTAASAFGAALALLASRGAIEVQVIAFGFGLVGVGLTYMLARVYRSTSILMLVLSGVVVAAFFSALLGGVKYVADPEYRFKLPLKHVGSAFQRRVWEELRKIPYGSTRTYTEVARAIGRPEAIRAVARACATNPVSVVVPCHRVVRRDGKLAGYRWGIGRKRELLDREGKVTDN